VASVVREAVVSDPSAYAEASARESPWAPSGGCPAVFRRDSLDSVDGSAVERTAEAVRDEEHGASTPL